MKSAWTGLLAFALLVGAGSPAAAQSRPWEMGMQDAVTPGMIRLSGLHDFVLVVITLISLFVLGLLIFVMVRFNERANPNPGRTTHNTLIEVIWTAVPVGILVVIAIPSFQLLYHNDVVPPSDMTIKAVGHQWYWSYQYPDNGDFAFDAVMVAEADLKPGQRRLLETDNRVVVPVGTTVRVQVTADDVIHSWALPAFGIKIDAVPGRLNETWFRAEHEGTYYGQCSELCGINHGFMPIAIDVVSKDRFDAWVAQARQAFAPEPRRTRLARAAHDARQDGRRPQ